MKRESRFIIVVVLVGLLLRLFRIGSQSLWVDEIFTVAKSIPKPGLDIWDYLKYNLQGPIHSFVIYCMHFASTGDAWLRVPSALAGAASVYYLYRWAEIWMGPRIARWAAVLLAVHPLHIQYSQELRAYAFVVFFVTFAGFHFHRMIARESRSDTVAYVLGIALAALSNFSAAFIYAVHSVLYIARRGLTGRRVLRWIIISLAVLLLISPWVYRIYVVIDVPALVTPVKPGELAVEQRLRGETTITPSAVPYLFYVFSVGATLGPSTRELHFETTLSSVLKEHGLWILWVAILFGFLSITGTLRIWREHRGRAVQALLYIVVPLVLLLAITWQNAKPFNVRYMLVSLPAYVCLVAAGLQALTASWKRVAAILVFVTLAISLGNFYFNSRYAKEDVEGAVRYVESHIEEGECVLAPTVTEVFAYYFGKPNAVHRVSASTGISREVLDERLGRYLADCPVVWYVRAREWDNDPDGLLLAALEQLYGDTTTVKGLTGIQIRRYAR
jgi:mannosyltransferase